MNDEKLPVTAGMQPAEESMFFDVAIALAKRKLFILGFTLAAVGLSAAVAFSLPVLYTGTTKIMPPQPVQSSATALLGQLSATGGLVQGAVNLKSPSEIFISMLKSRTVADALIERFALKQRYDKQYFVDARRELAQRTFISAARDGVITINVDDHDPLRASELANAYVEQLEHLSLDLAISEAGQRRLFFEKQVREARGNLTKAELELRRYKEITGVIAPEGQAQLTVTASAGLRGQITAKEYQLASMRTFATANNPDLVRAENELISLRTQLARMEKNVSQGKGDVLVSIGKAPEATLEFLQRVRDVKYFETLFELLSKQYELAKVDEAKNATLIQILDKALPPEKRSKPNRMLIVAVSTAIALLLACLMSILYEWSLRTRHSPHNATRWEALKKHLWRRTP